MSQGKKIIQCPKCGFTFEVSYGRTFACSECPSLVQCGMAKCSKYNHEFPLPASQGSVYPNLYRKFARRFE